MSSTHRELLFCDTFGHEGEEGQLHVDMVKFSPPVMVQEVRVVPYDVRAHTNANEVERVGLTQPSSFTLDVYINNSTNPLAPTFDPLGVIEYQPGTIALEANPKNSSDQLVVRGHYTVLTLCIYGSVIAPPKPPSPPPPLRRSVSPYSNSEDGFSDGEKRDAHGNGEDGDAKGFDLFEPFSPVNSPDHLFDLSDEEILPPKRSAAASGGYEELSDEEVSFDGDFDAQEGEDSYYGEEGWLTSGVGFNPYQCELSQLEYYQSSTDTPHEVLLSKLQKSDGGSKRGGADEASKLRDVILKQRDPTQPLKWVETVEEVTSYLYPGLAQLHKKSSSDAKEVMLKLVSWTLQCLDLETVKQLPASLCIRCLKAGMRLVPCVASLGRKCTNALVKRGVMERLCDVLLAETMTSTLKLLSLRALDSLLNYPQGMERFFGWDHEEDEERLTPYQQVLALQLNSSSARVGASVTALLSKSRVAELVASLQESVEKIVAVTPVKPVDEAPPPGDLFDLYSGPGGAKPRLESECTDEGSTADQGGLGPGEPKKSKSEPPDSEMAEEKAAEEEEERPVEEEKGEEAEGEKEGEGGEMEVKEAGEGEGEAEEKEGEGERKEEGEGDRKEEEKDRERMEEGTEERIEEEEVEKEDLSSLFPEEEISKIVQCLQCLKKALENAQHTTVQPQVKSFPTSSACFPTSDTEYLPPVVRMLRSRRLLHSLFVLLTSPLTNMVSAVFEAVRELLLFFLSTHEGTVFLSSQPAVMTAVIRALVPPNMEELQMEEDEMLTLTDLLGDDSDQSNSDSCTTQNLGLLLTYHLQVLQSLDMLRKASKLNMSELESADCIGALHTLYSMTLSPVGKCAVSHLLSLSDNVLTLLPFIEPRQQRDHDTKLTKSSVSSRYAAVLLLTLLKSSVRLDFMFTCGSKLLSAAEFFKDNSSPLMSDLYNWFSPVKELASEESSKVIPALVSLIKEKIPAISCNKPGKACSPIMTAVRILLCYVTPPPAAKGRKKDPKYTQHLIHLFSCNCMDTLLTFLNKFSDIILPVWSQRQSLSISNASIVVSLATFALQLLKQLLGSLLDCEDYQFRDTRVAGVLLRMHMVLCSAPYSTMAINSAHEIRMLIVDILVMYTKPKDIVAEGEETPDVSKNCWCLMLKEVFEHTLSSPHCFLSGLMILSELLPLPLPTHTAHPVSSEQLLHHRKLWALHLDPYTQSVSELVQTLLLSSANGLQQMLRRVCAQLADITAPLALLITQQIISTILEEIEKQLEKEEPEPPPEERGVASEGAEGEAVKEEKGTGEEQQATEKMEEEQITKSPNSPLLRILTTCSVLSQQNAVKVAILYLISQKETADTKGFSRFIPLLLFLVQKKETMLQHKLCIMTILNALCNMYVGLTTSDMEDLSPSEQQLSNCLPGKQKLETITSAVLHHVTSADQPLATMMLGLKIILSLCQYDIGLLNIYRLIPTYVKGFADLLDRLTQAVRSNPAQDTISCVSLFLQLLGHLLSSEVTGRVEQFDEGELQPSPGEEETSSESSEKKRDSHYETQSVGFPRPLLKMIVCSESGENLLANLRNALEQEDTSLLIEFTKIITTLEQEFEGVEPENAGLVPLEFRSWPPMQSVESQFEQRCVVSLSVDPPNADYWIASPPHDEAELEPDTAVWDLNKLANQTCPGLNLEEELKKQLLPSPPRTPPRADRKRKIALTGPEAQRKLREAMQQRMLHAPRRDMFRLRKQNTSRPPSMHVDDFMAAKSSGNRGSRDTSHDHGLGRAPGGGRGGAFPYMTQPMFLPSMGGGRWLGSVPAGLNYPRRDMVGGAMPARSWDSRGLTQAFLPPTQMKPSALSRNVSMYSALQAYSRASGGGRGPILWPTTGGRSSGHPGDGGSGHKSGSSSSRHDIYKRLV